MSEITQAPAAPDPSSDPRRQFLASLARRDIVLAGAPTELTVELTTYCQLRCVTCPRETRHRGLLEQKHMDYSLYRSIIETWMPHLDYLSLAGGLGEPLLYPCFADALALARSLNDTALISISTNALLPKTTDVLRTTAPMLSFIQVSIDGIGPVFDEVVGVSGAFPKFAQNVRELVQICNGSGTAMRFNSVVTRKNFDNLYAIAETVAAWGGSTLYFNGQNHVCTDEGGDIYDFYLDDGYVEHLERVKAYGSLLGLSVDFFNMRTVTGFESCNSPWNNFYIAWDGHVVPCCAKPFPQILNFGRVQDVGLRGCVESSSSQAFRAAWKRNESPEFCHNCHLQHAGRQPARV